MSSTGRTFDTTPLLPCRPAILSPGASRRFWAMNIRIHVHPRAPVRLRAGPARFLFLRPSASCKASSKSLIAARSSIVAAHARHKSLDIADLGELFRPQELSDIGWPDLCMILPLPSLMLASAFCPRRPTAGACRGFLQNPFPVLPVSAPGDAFLLQPPAHRVPSLRESIRCSMTTPITPGSTRYRRITDVRRLFTEYGAQQPFLGRELGFALGRDAADQDVAGPTSAPSRTMPNSSKSRSSSSDAPGISRVISSGPSLVSRD